MQMEMSGLGKEMLVDITPSLQRAQQLCPGWLSQSTDNECAFLLTRKFYKATNGINKLNKSDIRNEKNIF